MTTSSHLPIGAFSNATQLSVKALRLYAEQGLLVPARIDSDSGYRYYRPEQVQQARLIRLLRELDMPIAEIARAIGDPATIAAAAKSQMAFLARRYALQQSAYHSLLAQHASAPDRANTAVKERLLPPARTRVVAFEADLYTLLGRAEATLARLVAHDDAGAAASAAFILLPAAPAEREEIMIELCVPVLRMDGPTPAGPGRSWPETPAAAIELAVQDGVPDLVAASDTLFDWFDRRGQGLRDAPRLYLSSPTPTLVWPIS